MGHAVVRRWESGGHGGAGRDGGWGGAVVGGVVAAKAAAVLVWNVCSQSSRQRFTPTALLGRVLTSHRALSWGMMPIGALAGGIVAAHWGLRAVWAAGAVCHGIVVVIVWRALTPARFLAAEQEAVAREGRSEE